MNPNKTTKVFDNGIRMTRSHKLEIEERNDKSAFAWLLDWKAQLSIVLVFGIIGGSQLYLGNNAWGWGFIGIVIILSSAFVCFRIVLPFFLWLIKLVQ